MAKEPQHTDVLLVDGSQAPPEVGSAITLQADWVTCTAHDFCLDHPDRHTPLGDKGLRRALVHDFSVDSNGDLSDRLVLNFQGDYPDAVWVFDKLYIQAKDPVGKPYKFKGLVINPKTGKADNLTSDYIDVVQDLKEIRAAIAFIREKLKI